MAPARPARNLSAQHSEPTDALAAAGGSERGKHFDPRNWSPFWLALSSGLLMWSALPPLGWSPLGWLAPLGWLILIEREQPGTRRPYWSIYAASVLIWALTMQGIRLAHWANYLGLVALAGYLGIYLPIFVALAREARHRWRLPLLVVAPVVWVGVELSRGYGPLGFSMALLAHTQVKLPLLIQIADLCGPYTVSFVVMFVAACLYEMLPTTQRRWQVWPVIPIIAVLGLTIGYGRYRLTEATGGGVPLRIALIQGSIDTVFDEDPDLPRQTLEQYVELTEQAVSQFGQLDLLVWPETMFPISDVLCEDEGLARIDPPLDRQLVLDTQRTFEQLVQNGVRRLNDLDESIAKGAGNEPALKPANASWIFGVATWELGDFPARRRNTAMLVDSQGDIVGRYFKMHPVIFGEYVPFGATIPALYHLFPLPNGLTPGETPTAWAIGGLTLSPSICFENTMPHLMRRHVVQLTRCGQSPDVLINLTNDGWFWGSSILDMQLNCAIFRAVELRRPFVIAANTGFSASISGNGIVLTKGPRRKTAVLLAEVVPDGRISRYAMWGDWPASCCTLFCVSMIAGALLRRWRRQQ